MRAAFSRSLFSIGSRSCPLRLKSAPGGCRYTAELLDEGNVDHHIPIATNVGVLDDKVAATGLAVVLAHRWNDVALCVQGRVMTDLLHRIQERLACVLGAASVLLAGVDVITVRVDGVPIARTG